MGTTAQKLQKALDNKQLIIDKVNNKAGTSFDINSKPSDVANAIENIESGIDTSDATASANDILKDKSAYVNGEKVVGTIETYNGESVGEAEKRTDMLQARIDATNSCNYLFYYYTGNNVDFISDLDTSKVTTMSNMFRSCTKLTTIPSLDCSNVTKMNYMFADDQALSFVPKLNSGNVTDMSYMFQNCKNLETVEEIDCSNATNMSRAFYSCSKLKTANLLNTNKLTDTSNMFYRCTAMRNMPEFNTSSVTNMEYMFYYCTSLTSTPRIDTSSVTKMNYMFQNCDVLKIIDITYLNGASTASLASYCYSLKAFVIRSFGESYTLASNTFYNCYHMLGTTHYFYNPNGLKDGYIYVPRNMIETLSQSTNWSTFADQIRALEDYTLDGTTTGELNLTAMGLGE